MPMPSLAGWKSARTTPGVVALNVFSVGDVIQRGDKDPRHRAGAGFPNHRGVNCRQGHQRNQAGHAGRGSSHGLQPAHRPDHPLRRPSRFRPIAWSSRRTIIRTMSVRVDQAEFATLPNVKLYPGMPATVMIPTIQRTVLDYIVGPLVMSFNHSVRQK